MVVQKTGQLATFELKSKLDILQGIVVTQAIMF